jgi:hypothetical protein
LAFSFALNQLKQSVPHVFAACRFYFGRKIMTSFKSFRVAHEYTQIHPASPERVFPLLCPVREAAWIPDWRYRLIYSDSGIAELGCIFTTSSKTASVPESSKGQNSPAAETTWICVDYDPAAFRIAYVWIDPGRVATELRIQLEAANDGHDALTYSISLHGPVAAG